VHSHYNKKGRLPVNQSTNDQPVYHTSFTGRIVAPDGIERHFIRGAYGRENDLPSVIYPDGSQFWFIENVKRGGMGQQASVQHRDNDLPATIRANGDQLYYQFGKLHREGGNPAVIQADGTLKWFEKGKCLAYHLPGDEKRYCSL